MMLTREQVAERLAQRAIMLGIKDRLLYFIGLDLMEQLDYAISYSDDTRPENRS